MNKTVGTFIAGTKFDLEEKAFVKLDKYINQIKSHFSKYEDGEEIADDIQRRIAEKLNEEKSKVITLTQVNQLIRSMGDVSEFEDIEIDWTNDETNSTLVRKIKGKITNTRLLRDSKNKSLAGVCAGISNYFDIDPAIIRLTFTIPTLVLFFINPILILLPIFLYCALWISMPEAITISDQIEMRGEKVTLTKIENEIGKYKEIEPRTKIGKVINFPLLAIYVTISSAGNVIRAVWPIAIRLLGLSILAGSTILLTIFSVMSGIFLLYPESEHIGIPIRAFLPDANYYVLTLLISLLVLLPLIWTMLLGLSMLKLKNIFRPVLFIGSIGIWLVALVACCIIGFSVTPRIQKTINENPGILSEREIKREFSDFTKIKASGNVSVIVSQTEEYEVTVKGFNRGIEDTQITQNGDTLIIVNDNLSPAFCIVCIRSTPEIYISMPKVDFLDASERAGLNVLTIKDAQVNLDINLDSATLNLHTASFNSGDPKLKLGTVNINAKGTSRILLLGKGKELSVLMTDYSNLDADQFEADDLRIKTRGNSIAEVNSISKLDAESYDRSVIYYIAKGEKSLNQQDNSTITLQEPVIYYSPEYSSLYSEALVYSINKTTTFAEIIEMFKNPPVKISEDESSLTYMFDLRSYPAKTLIVTVNLDATKVKSVDYFDGVRSIKLI